MGKDRPVLLQDKVAIISGVGPGLGQEIALAFAREGAAVVLGARTGAFLKEVAGRIEEAGGRAVAVPTDITDAGQCQRLVDRGVEEFGGLDCLVNSAFRPDVFRKFERVDLAEWRAIFEVNVWGTLQLTHAAIPALKERGGGSIVFINSMIVRKPLPRQGGYAASKGALLTAAQVLAKELGPCRIRVNSVVPGWMDGPPVRGMFDAVAARGGKTVDEQEAEIVSQIPLGFLPPDEDCANAAVFFASDLAAVITGQTLDTNGGEVFA
jgi:NAD(P)-dependent dehydrogenase (short-subunit alcohol dehydrogenase family)